MTALVAAVVAAYGMHLLWSAYAFGWRGVAPGPVKLTKRPTKVDVLARYGLGDVHPSELAGAVLGLAVAGGGAGFGLFGGVLPALAGAVGLGSLPVAGARNRRTRRRRQAQEAWPRLIEEIRIKTTTLGRSIPHALLEVGARAPAEMVPAFEDARREWLLSTDFERTLAVLCDRLDDATADTVAETLLVAQAIGGNDVDRCLSALIDDRILDLQGRKDAAARSAGAKFARRFVVVVPIGMALVGLSIGDGRAAYGSATGQLLVGAGLAIMGACWWWAGRILQLPTEQRVFRSAS